MPHFRTMLPLLMVLGSLEPSFAEDAVPAARPIVPGKLLLKAQSRIEQEKKSGKFEVVVRDLEWNVSETAIVVCDMWDDHYCKLAAQRVATMVPRMNAVLNDARAAGAMIMHSPSGTLDFYKETPHRKRMQLYLARP